MPVDHLGTFLMQAPFPLIGAMLFGGMLAAAVLGHVARLRAGKSESPSEGIIVTSVFGLLALLTGFTFAIAIDRYDTRRAVVLEEANAIGTAYLRTQLLEEPHRTALSRILYDYTVHRARMGEASIEEATRMLPENDRLVAQLWTATERAFPTIRALPLSSAYLDSINAVIDLDAARKTSRYAHVPAGVLVVLILYVLTAAGVIGFVTSRDGGRASAALLFFLFGASVLLVIDLDRPRSGLVQESQAPIVTLKEDLARRIAALETAQGPIAAPAR